MAPNSERGKRLLQVACHEAGHVIVARHFGYKAFGVIVIELEGGREVIWGKACHAPGSTPFRNACIAWAGLVAEELWAGVDQPEDAEMLRFDVQARLPRLLSELDRPAAEGHPQRWRAVKTAWRILLEQRAEWYRETAMILVDHSNP